MWSYVLRSFCAFALLLTFLSIADLLLLQVRERRREIGLLQAVSWRPGVVQRMFVQEGLLLAIIGAIPGVLAAQSILVQQHSAQQVFSPLLLAIGIVLLLLLLAALAALPAVRTLNRM